MNQYDYQILKILNSDKAKTVDDRIVLDNKTRTKRAIPKDRPFIYFKPIFVLADKGTESRHLDIVVEALQDVLNVGGAKNLIPIHIFGYWNEGPEPYKSIDWFLQRAFNPKRNQCNVVTLYTDMAREPLQLIRPHYDVLILSNHDMYSYVPPINSKTPKDSLNNYNYIFGVGSLQGIFMSIISYKNEDKEVIKQAVLHEAGHCLLDLGDEIENSKGETLPN